MLRYGTSIHICIAGYCRYGHLWPPQEKCSMHGCIMPSSEVFWSKRTRFALRPFGGSVVILMQFCSNWMGNLGWQDLTGLLQKCCSTTVCLQKKWVAHLGTHLQTKLNTPQISLNRHFTICSTSLLYCKHLQPITSSISRVAARCQCRPAAWELARTRGRCGTSRGDDCRRSSQWAFPDLEANGRINDLVRSVLRSWEEGTFDQEGYYV